MLGKLAAVPTLDPPRKVARRRRAGIFFSVLVTALIALSSGASSHFGDVPPPGGPFNTWTTQNGGFGLLCAVKWVGVDHSSSGWYGMGETWTKFSSGGVCNHNLDRGQGISAVTAMVARSNGTYCTGQYTAYNPYGNEYWHALVGTAALCGSGPAPGQHRGVSAHSTTLYSATGTAFFQTPLHSP